jgi:hypothetical protein
MQQITGVGGGVPYVALPPETAPEGAPLVVAWHLHDPPRSETAMAAALPLDGLPAWRVYLGLPLSGSRLPEGGLEAFFQLGYQDAVLKVFDPTCRQAVEELPSALAALRQALPVADGPLGLVGGSIGALVAQSVLAETDLPVLRWRWSARRSGSRPWSPPTSGGSGSPARGPRGRGRPRRGWTS